MKHVLEAQQFTRELLDELFEFADSLEVSPQSELLKGKILASLFYEPSTRTRFSFESAMIRLGGNVLSAENAEEASSAVKGETLEDTVRVVNHYADVLVLRHSETGSAARASLVSDIPLINAGDGAGQHPTQALLDLYTIHKELGRVDDLEIALVGDLKNGRAARSLVYILAECKNIRVRCVSPLQLRMSDDVKQFMEEKGISYIEEESLDTCISTADVIYMTRVQKERFESAEEYEQHKGSYVFRMQDAARMKEGAIIMHPLPRVDEIDIEVDTSPKAAYFRQARYGVFARMALLATLLR